MPGPNYINSIKNFYRVFSGINDASAKSRRFFKKIISTKKYPLTRLQTPESSEMAKVLENSFRAMNISLLMNGQDLLKNQALIYLKWLMQLE